MNRSPGLAALTSEAIHILREGVAEARDPVILFSAGKDSTVLAHLALQAFYPSRPPMPLLHVDSTWEFDELLAFRDAFANDNGFELIVYANEEGRSRGLNPFEHGDLYTTVMRTDALKQALDRGRFDVIFGGARRDEEKTRAKERIVSVRSAHHTWDPRVQRPELWMTHNWRRGSEQTIRAYPLSNWTEADIWTYIAHHQLPISSLYLARQRTVVERSGALLVVDDPLRMRWRADDQPREQSVRFRTLGCWPVTASISSNADSIERVIAETANSAMSERQGRVSDEGSLEAQKREGYF
ncbi:MAG: sulfate adenylyltransferase subunit CysD [Alphaproteobacteria bacterium]